MRYIKTLFTILAFSLFIISCDKIDEPYTKKNNGGGDTNNVVRKVLLEDYTGHKCVNCPAAAIIAHDLKDYYKERLIIMSVHAGYFAMPSSSGDYSYDFRTPVGNELDQYFGISNIGNPNGMVNRKKISGSQVINPNNWGTAIGDIIDLPPDASISIENTFNNTSRKLSMNVETKLLNQISGNYSLCVYILEDSIVAAQKNNDPAVGDTPDILDYVHRHVLRGSVNDTWGESIGTETAAKNYSYTLNAEWDADNCYILAFIYNDDSKEIIQAEEKKVVE